MTQNYRYNRYDAIIIGGRCAGAAIGMLSPVDFQERQLKLEKAGV